VTGMVWRKRSRNTESIKGDGFIPKDELARRAASAMADWKKKLKRKQRESIPSEHKGDRMKASFK
jgi:hypothetical protein